MAISLLTYLSVIGLICSVQSAVDVEIQNKNVERTIDLASQLVKISYKITLEHSAKKNINSYSFLVPTSDRNALAYISIRDSSKKDIKPTEEASQNGAVFVVSLPANAPTQILLIETVFTKSLLPYPTEIQQSDRQLVRYFGNAHFYSPFKTLSQKTTVHLSSKNVESYTAVKPSSQSDSTITYGPYENVARNSFITTDYHTFRKSVTIPDGYTPVTRVIEVSHWGNIAVEETIDMIHSGATLKGSFSRYDYQKDGRSGQASIKSYKTILPAAATGVYYRDTNGNISTSAMRVHKDSVELDLRPRFPLFGGWKTHYTLGYNVPSFEYLFHTGENYLLKIRLVDHIYDDMAIDEVVVKIILPEGSTNIKLITPYPVTRKADSLHYTYLDTFGRPVIEFTKNNLVENHIHEFNLKYTFPKIVMIQEPLLIVGFLYILFLFVIVWMRLDFSITKQNEAHLHRE